MGVFNATKKVGTLLGGIPDEYLQCTKIFIEWKHASVATSVSEYLRDDDVVKAVANPKITEAPGPGAKNIFPGGLKNPSLW